MIAGMIKHEGRKLELIAASALLPDGSSQSIYCTNLNSGIDLDHLLRPIKLPSKTIIIPFNGEKFMVIPTYKEAKKKKIGHMRS